MDSKLLDIKIDYITRYQAVEKISGWLKSRGKHYVVTPNPEMLVDATFDKRFANALNQADLSIPDSSRLGWGSYINKIKNPVLRLILSPSFIYPHGLPRFNYPKTTGVDLMNDLLSLSQEKGFTTAYLGGTSKVADKLFKCLRLKYPKLKIVFCSGKMKVNEEGEMQFDTESSKSNQSKHIKSDFGRNNNFNAHLLSEKIDILFVAFGHKKQEKWMQQNLNKLNTRLMVGVGGAFDYISGEVPRAPWWMRNMGFEWLFRVVIQPWRIKRFWKLPYFVYMVLKSK